MTVRMISVGLVVIDGMLWHRCKARKAALCWFTKRPIAPGDLVYRPQTNGDTRMHRALATVVERMAGAYP